MSNYICTISLGNSNKSLSLEEYAGSYYLVSTWETRGGDIKPNWVFRHDRVDGENVPGKAIPLKLSLGDRTAAVAMLMQMAAALNHGSATVAAGKMDQTMTRKPPIDDYIPQTTQGGTYVRKQN